MVFAHGQMREHELERIMLDFINGEIDVLVSTTIIETGLDISNVNTIIIHDADRFGPVSYTHLDVYKRQVLENCIVEFRTKIMAGTQIKGEEGAVRIVTH